jgi:hypothetical protein
MEINEEKFIKEINKLLSDVTVENQDLKIEFMEKILVQYNELGLGKSYFLKYFNNYIDEKKMKGWDVEIVIDMIFRISGHCSPNMKFELK